MDSQSSSLIVSPKARPRVFSYKRRRNGALIAAVKSEDGCDFGLRSAGESWCTTSGESSSDENDSSFEVVEEEEAMVAAKRRRRADLEGLKKSVRHMEAQVVDASAQLKDLAALVAQVIARRQQQQLHA
ncbi:hypothetical protein GN244_ATG16088 [Phytophthora infestans]|uniref:Uncharacterized protein n=1 Tax=Phytophthora infestans TaxID=4787 RepID=A0A833SUB6_PHYIN|nr:hypothetical protein GN244_ATG16088 [Phytophthora infestans]KAI9991200.1 hypothetical protein PInf_018832 [Phytophthora infestans]